MRKRDDTQKLYLLHPDQVISLYIQYNGVLKLEWYRSNNNNNTKNGGDNKKYFKAANKSNPKIFLLVVPSSVFFYTHIGLCPRIRIR